MIKMITLSIQRLLQAIPLLIMISLLIFFLVEGADIDPEAALFPQQQSPLFWRYIRWIAGIDVYPGAGRTSMAHCLEVTQPALTICNRGGGIIRAELGTSTATGQAVWQRIIETIPATFALAGLGLGLGTVAGISLIRFSNAAQKRLIGRLVQLLALLGSRISWVWFSLCLFFLVGVHQAWFTHLNLPPDSATISTESQLFRLTISAVIVAFFWTALVCHWQQSNVTEIDRDFDLPFSQKRHSTKTNSPQIRSVSPRQAFYITTFGAAVGHLLAATVIVEVLFGWPGLGRLLLNATIQRDYPVVLGGIMITSVVVLIVHWLIDLIATHQQTTPQPRAKPPMRRLKTSHK
jgi:peptide/nickel transport system permease protein